MRAWALALLLALPACKAEDLGVEVPRGGVDTLSQEDLQRDVHLLASLDEAGRLDGGATTAEAAARVEHRLVEMHTLPAFDRSYRQVAGADWNLCGLREGRTVATTLVLALDGGRGADLGASPVAVLLSLAKGSDVPQRPTRSQVFCRIAPDGGLPALIAQPPVPWGRVERALLLGPLGGTNLLVEASDSLPVPASLASTGPDPVHGTVQDGMERIDYRVMRRHTRDLFQRVLAEGS